MPTIKSSLLFPCIALASFSAFSNALYEAPYVSLGTGPGYVNSMSMNGKHQAGLGNWGANLFLGTSVSPYFGPEVGVGYFGLESMGRVGLLGLSARVTGRFTDRLLLFGKLGAGVGELRTCYLSCTTTSTFVPIIGLGLGWGLNPQWMLSTEFNGAFFPQSTGNGNGVIGGWTIAATRYF